jgi:hypothetical protein
MLFFRLGLKHLLSATFSYFISFIFLVRIVIEVLRNVFISLQAS